MYPFPPRLAALLAALLLALPVGAFFGGRYFCRGMDRAMASCCCDGADAERFESGQSRLERVDCCKLIERAARDATPPVRDAVTQIPASALLATLPALSPLLESHGRALGISNRQARAPPALGPALYLQNCVLLT